MRVENLEGKKFGRLTPLERVGSDNFGRAVWLCECDCGNQTKVASHNLKTSVSSCGCSKRKLRHRTYHLPPSLIEL